MAPPSRVRTPLGEALRAARAALGFDQRELGRRVYTSSRQVSRWENGKWPSERDAERLFAALSAAPEPIARGLARALRIALPEDEAPAPPQAAIEAAPPSPAPPTEAALRASFDAVILASAEARDVLPRHLRGFALELFRAAERLGVSASEGANLVAPMEPGAAVAETGHAIQRT